MDPRSLLTTLALSFLLAAPVAAAGHVGGGVNPCQLVGAVIVTPVGKGPCPIGDPRGPCAGRDGVPAGGNGTCPETKADLSCLAIGLYATHPVGVDSQLSRAEAAMRGTGHARADAAAAQATLLPIASSAAALETHCRVVTDQAPRQACADAYATDVSLLGGLVTAAALESHVCVGDAGTTGSTRFTNLWIGGAQQDPIAHNTVIVIPGVGRVTIDDEPAPVFDGTGAAIVATALKVETFSPGTGAPDGGLVLVSHSAAHRV